MPEKKAATVKKGTKKKNVTKGQAMTCDVCGLSVIVNEVGDEVIETDNVLLCCGKQMKEKKPRAKATK